MAIQPLKLQRDLEQPLHALVVVAHLLQARLAVDRLLQGDRLGRVVRDQLGDLVHLAERQPEDAADVAHRRPRLQLAEGDDLGHPVGAVFAAHVVDHRVPPLLAEIDVEIRHRDAFGVEEALEQEVELQRIKIGDGQRPGGDRAGARPTPRTDRDAPRLRPLDEIGDDEEIPRKSHCGDDTQLVVEPLAIARPGRRVGPPGGHATGEPLMGHAGQRLGLGAAGLDLGAYRQQGLAAFRHHSAALGDRQRVVAGLGQVGKQRPHRRRGLEPVLRRNAPTLRLAHQPALGDAQQSVVCLVHGGAAEEAIIGGDQRQPRLVGQHDQAGLDGTFRIRAVPLQLHRCPVGKGFCQSSQQRLGGRLLALGEQPPDRAAQSAGKENQSRRVLGDHIEPQLRPQSRFGLQKAQGRKPLQVGEPRRVLRQQHDLIGRQARRHAVARLLASQPDLAADHRLHPFRHASLAELERPEQVSGSWRSPRPASPRRVPARRFFRL